MRRRASSLPLLVPLALALLLRCGPSGPGSPAAPDGPADPADAPRLFAVSPDTPAVHVGTGDRVEFRVEATSPRALPLSTSFVVDGVVRAASPTFVFEPAAAGTYRVVAIVSDGELTTTREWTVDVEPPPPINRPPSVVLSVEPGGGAAPLSARFRVEGDDPDGDVVRWRLELLGPDPRIVERDAPIDTVLALEAGDWQATAVVVDDDGASAAVSRAVVVTLPNQPPAAELQVAPVEGHAPLEVTVDASGHDPDGEVVRYRLDLDGDGSYEVDEPDPVRRTVRFEGAGTRWIRLIVLDDRGAEGADSVAVRVTDPGPAPPPPNAPPVAGLSVTPSSGEAPLEVTALAGGSDPDGVVVELRIDFDADGVPEASGPGPQLEAAFVYADPGDRVIRATAVDDDGATASATVSVSVLAAVNQPPVGSLTLDATAGDAPLEVTATATGSDPDGVIVLWEIEADPGDGWVELDDSHSAPLLYGFDPAPYHPRLRLTDDAGASTVVEGPPVTVFRPIGGGSGSVAGNPRFDGTGIAPAVWSTGVDPWRIEVTVLDRDGDPLAGVPLRLTPTRPPLSAPDGTSLGPGARLVTPAPVTGADGSARADLVTDLSTRIEEAPVIGFRGFDVLVEADAGHGEWRTVTRLEGLNANSTVAAADTRLLLRPANAAVCPGTSVELEVQAVTRSDAPGAGSPAAGLYTVLRYTDGSLLAVAPLPGYGDWRTDTGGIISFSYTPTRADQSRLVRAWVDGQSIDELAVLALLPSSECPD